MRHDVVSSLASKEGFLLRKTSDWVTDTSSNNSERRKPNEVEIERFVFFAAIENAMVDFLMNVLIHIPIDLLNWHRGVSDQEDRMSTMVEEPHHLIRHGPPISIKRRDSRLPPDQPKITRCCRETAQDLAHCVPELPQTQASWNISPSHFCFKPTTFISPTYNETEGPYRRLL